MNEKVQAYVKLLEEEMDQVESEISRMERTRSRIQEKLRSPEKYFNKELKRGSVKVKKVFGEKVPEKKSPFKRQKVDVEKIEVPTVEMNLPGPGPAAREDKKEKNGFGFFKG